MFNPSSAVALAKAGKKREKMKTGQIIGFATEFYTLWDYRIEPTVFTDAYGNHHTNQLK